MFGIEIGLEGFLLISFIFCVIAVCGFEFVNGFHDTANAVATVIYTKSLKPIHAVVWSGIMNFAGVMFSVWLFGLGVAMKIINLVPLEAVVGQNMHQAVAMMLAILLGAIIWNVATWYVGIPCSSSHTLIGSLLGVGIGYSMLPNSDSIGVNWNEAIKIGQSLLFSPLFGFSMAIALMFMLKGLIKNKEIFKEPEPDSKPPLWIRAILIMTCTLVSFFHGNNDGQKGVGLFMIILIGFLPLQFALAPQFDTTTSIQKLNTLEQLLTSEQSSEFTLQRELSKQAESVKELSTFITTQNMNNTKTKLQIRKRINVLTKNLKVLMDEPNVIKSDANRKIIKNTIKDLNAYTHYIPNIVLLLISISLGLGTMIGWKRIVVTIGEKIGKRHMTYAQGATAELIAASTIGLASMFSLPVSTTHVLSSGVAGAMVATKGVKNLQTATIKNIALAWLLTLPVTIILSGGLFLLFNWLF